MQKVESLGDIELEVLPSKVVRIMSKFSHKLRKYNGMVLKLSSKTVLKELEHIHVAIDDHELNGMYFEVEDELSQYLVSPTKPKNDADKTKKNSSLKDNIESEINSLQSKLYYRGVEID